MGIREEIYHSLLRINYKGAYSNLEVKNVSKSHKDEDRRLYLRVVYGSLQNQMGLDYLIQKQSGRPVKKIQKEVLEILRIAYYQLYFLDRMPAYAIVNESVKLVDKIKPKAKGFVNGVLRNEVRRIEKIGVHWEFPEIKDPLKLISIKYSMPLWIIKKYITVFGLEKTLKIFASSQEEPPFTIRCNTLKISPEELKRQFEILGVGVKEGKYSPLSLHLENLGVFHHRIQESSLYQDGLFAIQDQGAMLAVEALNPQKTDQVLDMCAAPGGKTTYLSQLMENQGHIIARDIYPSRLALIEASTKRMGCTNITIEKKDGLSLAKEDNERFDRILLDAPCSGLGVFRRKAEIRYQIDEKAIQELITLQGHLLENALYALKPGGFLLYATCTINQDENEKQIENLLKKNTNLSIINIHEKPYHYTQPLMDGCDGFFMCLIQK